MEISVARRMWQLLEPNHAVVYFAPEKKQSYEEAGLKGGWMGYFASRSAPMGTVPAEVVIATFYNFHPAMVRRAIPDAWRYSTPERVLQARNELVHRALTRLLGDAVDSEAVKEAAVLARGAALACDPVGRPLFAAHVALPWPESSHLILWHASTLLREFRGDGHVTSLVAHHIDGCEAHVLIAAAGITPGEMLREYRHWSDDEWAAAAERLRQRGLLDADEGLTAAGESLRGQIEDMTDSLALPPFEKLGPDSCAELETHMLEILGHIGKGHGIEYPNPIGLQRAKT